jgi:hypothetical protein
VDPVLTHLRRLVASLMLVTVTSFVLHPGAMAGLDHHADRSGISHIEVSNGCDPDGLGCGHTSHCSSVCAQALPSVGIELGDVSPEAILLVLVSQHGSGIEPIGLKRPPRSLYAV